MRLVIQRVSRASVRVDGGEVASVGRGLLVLAAVEKGDSVATLQRAAEKVRLLRCFPDPEGKMTLSVEDVRGAILAVSQFTLAATLEKGRRPSFDRAEEPERAREMFAALVRLLGAGGATVRTGVFGGHMEVELVNDGPVTFVWSSPGAVEKGDREG